MLKASGPNTINDAEPGQDVWKFCGELLALAYQENRTVLGRFNQHVLRAKPGMTREAVIEPWNDWQRRSYFDSKSE